MTRRQIFTRNARFSVKQPANGKPAVLAGYAIVWNTLSDDRGGYQVRLLPGSAQFATPTLALYGHDFDKLLGTTANGTLRIAPDDVGVKVEIDLPNTTLATDTAALVERGDIAGMSFAMVQMLDSQEVTENGKTVLNISKFIADEVSVTPIPAFTDTSIAVKPETVAGYAKRSRQRIQLARLNFNQLIAASAAH